MNIDHDRLFKELPVARGAGEGSELDLLVVAGRPVSRREQYAMVDVNLLRS